jgi:hypothetical protein
MLEVINWKVHKRKSVLKVIISLLGLVAPANMHFSSQSYLLVPQTPSVKKGARAT